MVPKGWEGEEVKATLEFDLSGDDQQAYERANAALDMAGALWDINELFRNRLKFDDKLTDEQREVLEKAWKAIHDILFDHWIDLDRIYS